MLWARMCAELTEGLTLELKDKKEPVTGCLVAEHSRTEEPVQSLGVGNKPAKSEEHQGG